MAEKNVTKVQGLVLIIVSVLVSLAAVEAIFRLTGFTYSPINIVVKGTVHDWRFKHAFNDEYFLFDRSLIWAPKAGKSPFNLQGFRGLRLSPNKGEEYRIFAIGDSNTLGWAGAEGAHWPKFLGQILVRLDPRFVVTNAGVYGYSSLQGLRRFRQTLNYNPDMVLISFGGNDAHLVEISDTDYLASISQTESTLLRFRIGHMILAVRDRLRHAISASAPQKLVHRVGVKAYEENLGSIIETSRKHNIICVLLTRPFTGSSPNELWWKKFAPQYVEATLRVGRRYGVPVVDVYDYFKDKKQLFADESHFTERGHKVAGEFIFRAILPLLPQKDRIEAEKDSR